jgi:hypothetical protein
MAEIGPGLRYWLPETEFVVTATRRKRVAVEKDSSRLVEVVDIDVAPAAVADRSNRRLLQVDAGFLEKIDLSITLDDRGFVTAVNSEAGRDVAPVLSLVGKVISASATIAILGVQPVGAARSKGKTLEQQWADRHPKLALRLSGLVDQVDRLLGNLGDRGMTSAALRETGLALDAVQSQLASIVEVRRAWIAAQSGEIATAAARLRPFELVRLTGPDLPELLPAGHDRPEAIDHARLLRDFRCLIAIIDPDRVKTPVASDGKTADRDRLYMRRSRPAVIGVYVEEKQGFRLQPESVQALDVVDRFCESDVLPLDGSWLRTRPVEFAYHPDMSLKTYGLKVATSAATVSASLGESVDAAAAAHKALKARPSAEAPALEKKKTELDLLKTESDFEVLAASRERAPAVAVAEQLAKLAKASGG